MYIFRHLLLLLSVSAVSCVVRFLPTFCTLYQEYESRTLFAVLIESWGTTVGMKMNESRTFCHWQCGHSDLSVMLVGLLLMKFVICCWLSLES